MLQNSHRPVPQPVHARGILGWNSPGLTALNSKRMLKIVKRWYIRSVRAYLKTLVLEGMSVAAEGKTLRLVE